MTNLTSIYLRANLSQLYENYDKAYMLYLFSNFLDATNPDILAEIVGYYLNVKLIKNFNIYATFTSITVFILGKLTLFSVKGNLSCISVTIWWRNNTGAPCVYPFFFSFLLLLVYAYWKVLCFLQYWKKCLFPQKSNFSSSL